MITIGIPQQHGIRLVRLRMTGALAGMLSYVDFAPRIQVGMVRTVKVARRVFTVPMQENQTGLTGRYEQRWQHERKRQAPQDLRLKGLLDCPGHRLHVRRLSTVDTRMIIAVLPCVFNSWACHSRVTRFV